MGGHSRLEGQVQEISECGCRITAGDLPAPGTNLRLSLNIFDISVALKAQVKYIAKNLAQSQEHGGVRPIGSCDRAVESGGGGGGSWIVLTGDPVVASSRTPS